MMARSAAPSTSEAIVTKIAEERGIEPSELSPLYECLDGEVLDALIASMNDDNGAIHFVYHGHAITAHADGRTDLSPLESLGWK